MEDDDLLTVSEVAERLRVSGNCVYGLIRSHRLPATKIGNRYRIRWGDYRTFITPAPTPSPQTRRESTARKERIKEMMRGYRV